MMDEFMTQLNAQLTTRWIKTQKEFKDEHWPHTHVGFVFLPINDAQQSGSLVVFKVESHIINGFYCKTK